MILPTLVSLVILQQKMFLMVNNYHLLSYPQSFFIEKTVLLKMYNLFKVINFFIAKPLEINE